MPWQPGDLTSAQLQEEWFEFNGWTAQPSAGVLAQWRETAASQAAYAAASGQGALRPDEVETAVGADLPELLVLPAHPQPDGTAGFAIELAEVAGRSVIVGYSSAEELVAQLGSSQPWIALSPSDVAATHAGLPIVLNPVRGIAEVTWSDDRLAALRKALGND